MYFLDYLCDISKREGCSQYIASVARDLPRIVQLVAPGTKAGAMNIKVVLKVLHSLQQKELLPEALVTDLTSQLEQRSRDAEATIANPGATGLVDRNDGISDLDHETIDQRMEEDRERHKRLREDAWAVDSEKEAEAMMEAARRAGGLTEKLAQECRDDGRERDVAVELDRKKWEELGAARTNAVGQADEDVEMG
jgi:CTD kinase subunit gamma